MNWLLGDAHTFSSLDASNGYWQILLDIADREHGLSTSHHVLYQFSRTPLSSRGTPAAFKDIIVIILSGVKRNFFYVFLDDIAIFSKISQEQIAYTKIVLRPLDETDITLRLKKCSFFTNSVDDICHVMNPDRLKIVNDTAGAIGELDVHREAAELRSLLGPSNIFSLFVCNLARFTSPLPNDHRKPKTTNLDPLTRKC